MESSAIEAALARLHERLDHGLGQARDQAEAIQERIADVAQITAEIRARCGPCRDDIQRVVRSLYGNGRPDGIVQTVAALAEHKRAAMRIILAGCSIAAAAVGAVATWAIPRLLGGGGWH